MATKPQVRSGIPEHAEVIGDVDEGTPADGQGVDELGLTPEERAAFDGMRDGPQDAEGPADPDPAPEPDPAAATAPDPAAPPPADVDEDDAPDTITTDPKTGKPQKTINYGKHQRLMAKAQKDAETIRANAEQARLDNAKLAERLAILNEALMAPAAPPPVDPNAPPANPMQEKTIDPAEDAIGALAQMQRRQAYLAESANQAVEQTNERIEDQELINGFTRDVQNYARSEEGKHFMGTDGAYQFLKNSRLIELGISLFDKDPTDPNEVFTQAEINKMIEDYNVEERWVAQNALNHGKSPAQAIMKLARGRGWKAPQAAAAAPAAPAAAAPAAAPPLARPPAAPAAAAPGSAVAKLQAEAEGAAASRSLSDGGGAPPQAPLDAQALLKMSEEEFGRYVDNMPKDRLDAIMGRPPVGER